MSEVNWHDRTWVYHPTEAAKIVTFAEAKELLASGWSDSPGKEQEKSDGEDNELEEFTRPQLIKYAKEVFKVDIDKRMTKPNMIKAIGVLHDGKGTS